MALFKFLARGKEDQASIKRPEQIDTRGYTPCTFMPQPTTPTFWDTTNTLQGSTNEKVMRRLHSSFTESTVQDDGSRDKIDAGLDYDLHYIHTGIYQTSGTPPMTPITPTTNTSITSKSTTLSSQAFKIMFHFEPGSWKFIALLAFSNLAIALLVALGFMGLKNFKVALGEMLQYLGGVLTVLAYIVDTGAEGTGFVVGRAVRPFRRGFERGCAL